MTALVLGVESSCDETAAAVVDTTGQIRSSVVRTQVELHAPYGGVVPELAARDHMRNATAVTRQALREADLRLETVDAIAVTHRPGLIGALLVGVQVAKGLAWAHDKPLVGVDHLIGHLLSPFMGDEKAPAPAPAFPFVGLLVSGGHTALYRCDGPFAATELGATRDDAAGEAFDKVAKLLGLGYPGGPVVDRLAATGDPTRIALPAPMASRRSLELSFSGLKSAVARRVQKIPPRTEADVADLCAAFQRVVVSTLVTKLRHAVRREAVEHVVVAGGVAANRELRHALDQACRDEGVALHIPPRRLCTDNAAMIAYAGALRFAAGQRDDLSLAPFPHTALPRVTRKGRGRR